MVESKKGNVFEDFKKQAIQFFEENHKDIAADIDYYTSD